MLYYVISYGDWFKEHLPFNLLQIEFWENDIKESNAGQRKRRNGQRKKYLMTIEIFTYDYVHVCIYLCNIYAYLE